MAATNNSGDDFESDSMSKANVGRRTYLVTYSQANLEWYPTRQSFGEMVKAYFDKSFCEGKSKVKTDYFAVGCEKHEYGVSHYNMSLKLT